MRWAKTPEWSFRCRGCKVTYKKDELLKPREIKSPDRNFYTRQLRNIHTRDRLQQKWFEKYKHIPGENLFEAGFYNQLGQMEQMNQFQTYKDSRHVGI